MEWVIAFTIIGLYSAQTFLVCAEIISPSQPRPRGGFTRRSYWSRGRATMTPAQAEAWASIVEEARKRRYDGEKVNWKEEGF